MTVPALAHAGSPAEGRWNTPKEGGVVEVYEKGGALYGKLVASSNEKAPLGTIILKNFKQKDGVWTGKIFVPERNRTLDAELRVEGNKLKLTVHVGIRTKKVTWNRA